MQNQHRTQKAPVRDSGDHHRSSDELERWDDKRQDGLSRTHRSPFRFLIVTIVAIFAAEIAAMIAVYFLKPLPYYQMTLIDAGIMTLLIFPVLYYFSFRPLIRQMEKSWRAEEALLQSRELQEKFFDSIDTLIAYMDRDFNFIRVNDAYAKAAGHTPDYYAGKNHFKLFPHEENQAIFEQVVCSGEPFQAYEKAFEYPDQPDRGVTYWNWSLQPVKSPEGMIEGLVLSLVEVTERKRAEQELRKAYDELEVRVQERTEELRIANSDLQEEIVERTRVEKALRIARDELELRVQERTAELVKEIAERKEIETQLRIQTTAMEAAANGIVITDHQGTIQWVNPALLQITGYDSAELIGQNMRIFKSGQQDADYYGDLWGKILSGQIWQGKTTNQRKDGRLYVEEQTIAPVWSDSGQITQFIAVKQDITQRNRAEEALRESEEKFRTLVEWTYDWEIWLDPHGKIVYCSPSCERITGYRPEEFIADPQLKLRIIHADDQASYQSHQRIVHDESAGVEKTEYRILSRDGTKRWIEHTCRPLFGTDNRYLGRRMSNRDITEQKRAEQDLRERNQKEKILTQTIHTMQLDIARDLHDTIGQNISFLRMKLDHLAEKDIRKPAEIQLELQSMARAANESYDLMRGTLAVLQSENSTDLFRLFTRYAEQIEERASFEIDLATQGEPKFMSARRMRQLFYIFREILNNIEKHANASQVSIKMTWDQDCLNLLVFDNGGGFELDKVQYGSHYGLKFMRERVELLNGSILIRSAIGLGTDIILQVPYE